ncbi:YcxB family protein [Streptomyces adelaidensis]|uniref:YcxB family protein n=1 Tax=Streptomyces adelaidensis TaxID=2796465 RepID=UPI001F202E54|nr:YcxB family protein [Streptomyces adelaidensis]
MAEAGAERGSEDGAVDPDIRVDRVELVYRATAGEFREALRVLARASAAGRWGRGLLLFSGGLGLIVAAVPLLLGAAPEPQALVMVTTAVLGLLVLPRLAARRLQRRAAPLGTHRTVLDLWGVTVEHDRGTERAARWSEVSRYAETPRTFVLLGGGPYATRLTVLPKSGLSDPADTDRLRAVLDGHGLTRL